jgi:hypothetical protein
MFAGNYPDIELTSTAGPYKGIYLVQGMSVHDYEKSINASVIPAINGAR